MQRHKFSVHYAVPLGGRNTGMMKIKMFLPVFIFLQINTILLISRFSHRYYLTCRHIFHFDNVTKRFHLAPTTGISMFDELGSEVYEMTRSVPVRLPKKHQYEIVNGRRQFQIFVIAEQLRWVRIDGGELLGKSRATDNHTDVDEEAVAPLVNSRSEILERHRPWELQLFVL